jgi:aquaporin SIP
MCLGNYLQSSSSSWFLLPWRQLGFLIYTAFDLIFTLQVIGSITGVRLIIETFPEIGLGPRLNVDINRGALTEGFLTFAIVTISLGLARKIPGSFIMKTWISSVSKLTLHILGSDLTGGCMNPASVSI